VDTQTEGTYESSRKYEIHDNASEGFDGLITVEGGKYTTSRHLAENVLEMVENKLNRRPVRPITEKEFLSGCEIKDMEAFMAELKKTYKDFSAQTVDYAGRNYGTEARAVFDLASQDKNLSEIVCEDGQILASVIYAVRNESSKTLTDILFRRTGIGNIGHPGEAALEKIGIAVANELGWDDEKLAQELKIADAALRLPSA
jgi:glycerol-3-phosphate dehydrogenase